MGIQTFNRTDGTPISVSDGFSNWNSKTLFQSVVLGLVLGPIIWGIQSEHTLSGLIWAVVSMALAPLIVDFLRPTVRVG